MNLELFIVFPPHTNNISLAILVEELFKTLLCHWLLFTETFLVELTSQCHEVATIITAHTA